MKLFSVYLKKDRSIDSAIFVEEGFSFKAFIFSYLWLLFNKMWFFAFTIFVIHTAVSALLYSNGVDVFYISLFDFIIMVYLGVSANQWRELSLYCKCYKLKETLIAPTLLEAQLKFFNAYQQNITS